MSNEMETTVFLRDYRQEIVQLLQEDMNLSEVREALLQYHENDIAAALADTEPETRQRAYEAMDIDTLASVLEYSDDLPLCLSELSTDKKVKVLSRMEAITAIAYLEELDQKQSDAILAMMEEEAKKEIVLLTSFDKDEIGSRMTTDYISIHCGIGVKGAMRELVVQAADIDNVSTIYVVDEKNTFVGAIDLKDLIRARAGMPLEEIMMTSYPYVYAKESVDDCVERMKSYSEDSIPVLDGRNRLKGVLTAQVLAEIVEDEIGDDYAKLGGLTEEEDVREPLRKSIGKRLPWLVILFGLGLVVSSVVGIFDSVISYLPVLVSFQSLILGMAGNVGTQSLAVTIRSLTDDELSGRQKFYLIVKEARVGLCNGLIVGILSFLLIGAYLLVLQGEGRSLSFSVSFCTGIALTISMLLSSVFGTTIPILFQKMKIDPAVASGPFITTINDLVAVVTYYGLAWLLLLGRL